MENINAEKIIGYILLIAGFVVIVYSVMNVLNVFQGKSEPFNLFSFDSIAIDLGKLTDQPIPASANLKQELVSEDLINKPINLTAHFFLMGFIASAGFKIAQVGVLLIRPIKVNLLRKADVEVKQ
jgi:hypothetical protein